MSREIEDRAKELFEETQKKQRRQAKIIILVTFAVMGLLVALMGILVAVLEGDKQVGIAFLISGLVCIAVGIVLYFALPKKPDYDKYKARARKYGYMDFYALSSKIAELEARIEALENGDREPDCDKN